ncbi:cold-regulated protein 28 isoform X2 [Ipomoea triloba]|uniref:cold-regulated protein 28 isoform X2 n=1 Tax=Ipomoea triloba TaxID=35885 RepID=UPI00125D372F|nr:cold-regulated protein 28 isoform X2 [Ipomoea triloba]
MEGRRRTAAAPPAQNPASSASFTTHSSYDASSLTVENSEQVLYPSDDCTRWTNEKHNLFLNLLEASFVKKMHKSMTLHSQYQEQNMVNRSYSHKLPAKMNRVSKQRPVVQDCHWHNNIERDLADLDTAAISHGSFKDQQICPFSHSEGSDQNFVDEGHKEKTSSKRTNASIREICNHDQIVPSGKFKNPAASSSTLESYDQASHEHLLLENYESFVGPCTNAKYFLNGS